MAVTLASEAKSGGSNPSPGAQVSRSSLNRALPLRVVGSG